MDDLDMLLCILELRSRNRARMAQLAKAVPQDESAAYTKYLDELEGLTVELIALDFRETACRQRLDAAGTLPRGH